jgi:copper transport protein
MTARSFRSATLCGLLLALLLTPRVLDAHAHLRRSFPAKDAELVRAPRELQLWFSEQPQLPFTQLTLLTADSASVPLGALRLGDDMSVVAPITGAITTGAYTVVWQTGGADGHPSRGRFSFRVRVDSSAVPTALGASSATGADLADTAHQHGGHGLIEVSRDGGSAVSARALVATRWLEFVGLLVVVGVIGFRTLLVRTTTLPAEAQSDALDAARRLGRSAVLLLALAALVRLHSELRAMHGPRAYAAGVLQSTILGTSWGRGWLLGVAGLILVWLGCTLAGRYRAAWLIAAAGALAAAFTPALTGHAIASPVKPAIAVITDGLHVLGAGTWLGTLAVMIIAGIPALRRRAEATWGAAAAVVVRGFSPMALTGASVVVLSGIVSATFRLGAIDQLWMSVYGRVLLLKVALFVLVALMGAWNWRRIAPVLGDSASAVRVRRSATLELTAAALVLAATAALVAISPPDQDITPRSTISSDSESNR